MPSSAHCLAESVSANVISNQHDRQGTYRRNIETRSRNHCYRGKAIIIKYYDLVFLVFIIQNTKRMRHIILSPVCLYNIFPRHKRHDFREKKNIKCGIFPYNFYLTHLSF